MSDEQRTITDNMHLSELTVGEFKALMREMLAGVSVANKPDDSESEASEAPMEKAEVKRKSLDEFMNGLG